MLEWKVDARLLSSLSRGHKDTDEKTEEGKRSAGKKSKQAEGFFISYSNLKGKSL